MKSKKSTENTWLPLIAAVIGFFATLFAAIRAIFGSILGKTPNKFQKNHLLESFHFIFHDFPEKFWKQPTGIGIGRSIGEVFLFFFKKIPSKNPPTPPLQEMKTTEIPKINSDNPHSKGSLGFSLIEIIVSMTVLFGIIIAAFMVFGDIGKIKNRSLAGVDIYEQITISSNLFFTAIKDSGTIDYEEYFNRSMLGTTLSGGHYAVMSNYGNTGTGYLCRSSSGGIKMDNLGCYGDPLLNTLNLSQTNSSQRYGSYKNQFIDYNSNGSGDNGQPGDQDRDGNIRGDDDDEDIGKGPEAFSGTMHELYLIKQTPSGIYRNIFRLTYEKDAFAPPSATCNTANGTGTGCIGRLQMLQLEGRDYGINHGIPTYSYDGVIDTWICTPGYFCSGQTGNAKEFMPTGSKDEWTSLFSDDINVEAIEFKLSPTTKTQYAWKDPGVFEQNPNVRVKLRIGYGWKKKRLLGTQTTPTITLTTTVNLYE